MKKFIYIFLTIFVGFATFVACDKKEDDKTPETNAAQKECENKNHPDSTYTWVDNKCVATFTGDPYEQQKKDCENYNHPDTIATWNHVTKNCDKKFVGPTPKIDTVKFNLPGVPGNAGLLPSFEVLWAKANKNPDKKVYLEFAQSNQQGTSINDLWYLCDTLDKFYEKGLRFEFVGSTTITVNFQITQQITELLLPRLEALGIHLESVVKSMTTSQTNLDKVQNKLIANNNLGSREAKKLNIKNKTLNQSMNRINKNFVAMEDNKTEIFKIFGKKEEKLRA